MAVDQPPTPARSHDVLTIEAVVLGLLLSVIMGAANVYLGLKVGMTVSASIPAAVIALAILNGMMRRTSILEANLVQTSASAGESLAAGIIFTMPALVLTGIWTTFDFWTTTLIALSGGLLGILFMIPMRRVFVVDNAELQYPEGVACAEVLRTAQRDEESGEQLETGASVIFLGLAIGAVFKFAQSYLGLMKSSVEWATFRSGRVFAFGADIAPALLGVGAIVGLSISAQVFLGGAIGWLITIPLISEGVTEGDPVEAAFEIWSTRVRYMGVGAMLVGGLVSIWKVRGGLVAAVNELLSQFQTNVPDTRVPPAEERNIGNGAIIALSMVTVGLIGAVYYSLLDSVGITLATTVIMVVMSFFFTAVASYIVGLVGNSNSPVSGMTITAVLGTGGLILLFNALGVLEAIGTAGMIATLGVAGIVCCVACTAGDVCNDLKTGHLVGASPRSQQIMQVAGVLVAAFVMAPVLTVLHEGSINSGTGGIGGSELSAPQATLFKNLVEGLFGDAQLPWDMVMWGVVVGVVIAAGDVPLAMSRSSFRLHVMPVAVGIYLPLGISVPILLGGFLRFAILDRAKQAGGVDRGVLAASGLIAGESLVGVLVGLLAFFNLTSLKLSEEWKWSEPLLDTVSIVTLLAVAIWMCWTARRRAPLES